VRSRACGRARVRARCAHTPSLSQRSRIRPLARAPLTFSLRHIRHSGYIYKCINDTAPDAAYCPIERVTWRGVNCSDAVGSEHNYFELVELLRHNATRPRVYNDTLQAPFFNFVDSEGVTSQVWYDDPLSLSAKYSIAKASGWLGVGMWCVARGGVEARASASQWRAPRRLRSRAAPACVALRRNLDTVDYTSTDPLVMADTAAMWQAIAAFRDSDA
jgi:hypothetical protein